MTPTSWEQTLVDEVAPGSLMEITGGIARWARLSGSDGELQAVNYVRDVLEGYGLQTEIILHDAYISLPGKARIELSDGERLACITHSFGISTGPVGLLGELAPYQGRGNDVAGHIALIDGLTMPGRVIEAEEAGAIGQIYVHGDLTHEMCVSPVWGNPDRRTLSLLPHTPVVSVDARTGERLRSALERGEPAVRIYAEVDTGWRRTPILIASIPADDTADFVLFSGHIDSWYLGAMDNGSANAAMVEVGRLMAGRRERLRRGLRLAFWSGHSHGRYSGSAWYADNHWLELHRHCVAHVNVDSLGGRGATVLTEGVAMPSTRALGADAIREVAGETFRGSRLGRAGDQSFVGLGAPSLWMSLSEQPPAPADPTADAFAQLMGESRSGGLGWWWHTTEDTVDKLDPDLLLRDARIYALAIGRLLTARLLPFDPAAEARELLEHLEQLPSTAVDLSAALDLAKSVLRRAKDLLAWKERQGEHATEQQVEAYNCAVTGMLRELISIDYTAAGPFGHDPALSVPPLPSLHGLHELARLDPQSDEAHFLAVELTQARNRVLDALDRALDVARHDP